MALVREDFEKETLEAWRVFVHSLDQSLVNLEQDLKVAKR